MVRHGEATHRRVPHRDVDRLLKAPEDVLLDIGDAVALADGLDEGLRLLVREHREIGPQVVLDLVVEPTMHEVDRIRPRREIDGADRLAQIEAR